MEKAPILLLTYNRDEELKKTITNLVSCHDSNKYDLFVHIDAPNTFRDGDVRCYQNIRECINEYRDMFNTVNILGEAFHRGLANSVISSVTEIIGKYGKIIVIEDDLCLSKDCLNFLDDALNYYENDNRIWSVTGYTPPIDSKNRLCEDVYFSYRSSSWAWATWEDRWNRIDWDVKDFEEFINDSGHQEDFCRGGYDLPQMLARQKNGLIDSWAVRWCYSQSKYNMLSVYPQKNRAVHTFSEKSTHVLTKIRNEIIDIEGSEYAFCEPYIDDEVNEEFALYYGVTKPQWNKWANNDNSNWYKFEGMFEAMYLWKSIIASGHNILEYFVNRGYKKVAIYGKGKIGLHLEQELNGSDVEVSFFIDRDDRKRDIVKCFLPDDTMPDCDVIVITVTGDISAIVTKFLMKCNCDVKSILDVLKDR